METTHKINGNLESTHEIHNVACSSNDFVIL